MPTALIVGITGQDGSYLAELLLDKGYDVHGTMRRASSFNTGRIDHIWDKLHVHFADVLDPLSVRRVLTIAKPDLVFNLAAQSHVKVSFDEPVYSVETVAMGCLHVLEAVREYRDSTNAAVRFYQASSSEMFGSSPPPQNEKTAFRPRSPYGCAKVYAYWQTVNYREAYGLWACNGILFNHESPRRGPTFVTRKITRHLAAVKRGENPGPLRLGNVDARRDWGFAGDYAEAMLLMMHQDQPADFCIGTGESYTVAQFVQACRLHLDLWDGDLTYNDEKYLRPTDVTYLQCDPDKARDVLGWTPKVGFSQLVAMMCDSDLKGQGYAG